MPSHLRQYPTPGRVLIVLGHYPAPYLLDFPHRRGVSSAHPRERTAAAFPPVIPLLEESDATLQVSEPTTAEDSPAVQSPRARVVGQPGNWLGGRNQARYLRRGNQDLHPLPETRRGAESPDHFLRISLRTIAKNIRPNQHPARRSAMPLLMGRCPTPRVSSRRVTVFHLPVQARPSERYGETSSSLLQSPLRPAS
jgi:hypothetical protein